MLVELFELASNSALEYEPKSLERLKKLDGKTMVLTIKPINQSIAVTPSQEGVEYSRDIPDLADVTLTTTIGAMIKISRDGFEQADLQPGELEMSGDPIIGQRFAQIIADLDIDWDGLLAEHLGDSTARILTTAAGFTRDVAKQSKIRLQSQLNNLITDELGITASAEEVERFLDDVDTLRADAERLALRLQRLTSNF